MSNFPVFAKAIKERFDLLSKEELYTVQVGRDELFELYLASFPEGTNPIFRVRTEHDGSYDRAFIRNAGHIVTLKGGKIDTLWNVKSLPAPYDAVAKALHELVLSRAVVSIFRTDERGIGHAPNVEIIEGTTHRFTHFHVAIANRHFSRTPAAEAGSISTSIGVFRRGMEELRISSVDEVLDLIGANAIYRGAEFEQAVKGFQKLIKDYPRLGSQADKDLFLWANIKNPSALLRNTVIGTLIQDLSELVQIEVAVAKFENKMSGTNYKRTSALITPKMIEQAVERLNELGLESAVKRRFAKIDDVAITNVLWANNDAKGRMKDGIAGLLMDAVKPAKVDIKGAQPISGEEFFENVLPNARSIDLMVENKHASNFMSVTAPVDPDAGSLFKWGNNFAWSYDGDVADSVLKERVKKAGGNVTADFRISLGWFNYDDLDIHVHWPGGSEIYYGNKQGLQDVDMNVSPSTRTPAENVSFNGRNVVDGIYKVIVHNFTKREGVDVGFELEVESLGAIYKFQHPKAVSPRNAVQALLITVKGGVVTAIATGEGVSGGSFSSDKWGIKTETLVPVETLMASPNHWDGQSAGNKHWFFILKDCVNPEPARGIYNEFLKSEFEPHRKVFEVLGAKTKCEPSAEQLSGVGFSSTRKDKVVAVVRDEKTSRAYEIQF